jgi:hypothetical protein
MKHAFTAFQVLEMLKYVPTEGYSGESFGANSFAFSAGLLD